MTGTVLLSLLMGMGLLMYIRGLIYSMRPDGPMAKKRQKKNLKYGMSTDMLVFGKKLRRLGFMVALGGGVALAYMRAGDDAPATEVPEDALFTGAKADAAAEKRVEEAEKESAVK
ncbi:MAG: hypothetical protein GY822_30390 [Deltaproteobacteria bacterium]|nr:hypothetical protein [Deltaproteobacteria bacterium]